jgi:hypothetical protein
MKGRHKSEYIAIVLNCRSAFFPLVAFEKCWRIDSFSRLFFFLGSWLSWLLGSLGSFGSLVTCRQYTTLGWVMSLNKLSIFQDFSWFLALLAPGLSWLLWFSCHMQTIHHIGLGDVIEQIVNFSRTHSI